jgi:hypothetical protein
MVRSTDPAIRVATFPKLRNLGGDAGWVYRGGNAVDIPGSLRSSGVVSATPSNKTVARSAPEGELSNVNFAGRNGPSS